MQKPNAHRVFTGTSEGNHYLRNITPAEKRVSQLRAAREQVRDVLRKAIPAWSAIITESVMFDSAADSQQHKVLAPKFRLQGSMAYYTLNLPAHRPMQEIDSDDGMFLPVSFISANNAVKPAVATAGLFKVVETSLQPLCTKNRWELDSSKDTCVRIDLKDGAHLDLALYAIPDSEFATLVEAYVEKAAFAAFDSTIEFEEPLYKRIPSDKIMLAHRKRLWVPSDPRKLQDWFQAAIDRHGQQLRRVCRYLKGWRDFTWQRKGPSSIALMQCVVTVYDQIGKTLSASRDDQAVVAVADRLSDLFSKQIPNPVVSGEFLDADWKEARQEYIAAAASFAATLNSALKPGAAPSAVLQRLTEAFGNRIPSDASLIEIESQPAPAQPVESSALISASQSTGPKEAVQKRVDSRYA